MQWLIVTLKLMIPYPAQKQSLTLVGSLTTLHSCWIVRSMALWPFLYNVGERDCLTRTITILSRRPQYLKGTCFHIGKKGYTLNVQRDALCI